MAGRMHPCSKNPSTPLDFLSLLLTMESVVPEDRALLESNPSAADDAETHRPGDPVPNRASGLDDSLVFWQESEKLILVLPTDSLEDPP
jgi:hypothetical protein